MSVCGQNTGLQCFHNIVSYFTTVIARRRSADEVTSHSTPNSLTTQQLNNSTPASIPNHLLHALIRQPDIGAKFLYRNHLVFLFVQRLLYFAEHFPAVALASSGNKLDVFRVNAEPGDSGFHRSAFLSPKFVKPNGYFSVGFRYYRVFLPQEALILHLLKDGE